MAEAAKLPPVFTAIVSDSRRYVERPVVAAYGLMRFASRRPRMIADDRPEATQNIHPNPSNQPLDSGILAGWEMQ